MEVLQFHVTGGKKSSSLRMLEALAMAVWSAMIGYFRLIVLCVPFVGFQVSTEITSADSTLSMISVDVFGYDSATIYFAISVAAVRCDLLGSTNIGWVLFNKILPEVKCGL